MSRGAGRQTPIQVVPRLDPTIICDGLWYRTIDGVDITDRYHVSCGGQNGFYGVPNHRSHHDIELRGTYKSILCLKTGMFVCKCFIYVVNTQNA